MKIRVVCVLQDAPFLFCQPSASLRLNTFYFQMAAHRTEVAPKHIWKLVHHLNIHLWRRKDSWKMSLLWLKWPSLFISLSGRQQWSPARQSSGVTRLLILPPPNICNFNVICMGEMLIRIKIFYRNTSGNVQF